MMGRVSPLLAICTLCICFHLACVNDTDPASERVATVTVAFPNLEAFDPSDNIPARYLMFLPLVALDERGEFEGRLARRWEFSPDYREATWHLRNDIRWHDGTPVTAHDVKFSMDLMTHPEVLYERPGYFGEVTVVDDSTLKIIEGEPGLDEVYFPRHLLEHLDPAKFYEWDFWKKPVGNGPYRFVRHEPHTMVELEANPDYYDGGPRIRRVILKFSQAAGLPELLSGAVDAIWAADPADVPKLGTDARFRVYHSLAASWVQQLIYWKTDHPLFRDRRVRRALTLAIDRRLLIRAVNLPEIIPVIDGYYSRRQLARGGVPEPLPHDPGEALRLLESAGWRDADGDGVRERGGKEFRFTALTPTAYNLSQIALLVQDQLRRVGVRMEIQMFEAAVVQHRLEAGEFEVVVGWNGGGQLWNVLHLGEGPPLGYENPEIAELGKPDTFDPAELDRRKRRIAEIIQEDLPVTFLFPAVGTFIVHRRIRGLSSPWQADPLRHMDELWIEEGR